MRGGGEYGSMTKVVLLSSINHRLASLILLISLDEENRFELLKLEFSH